MVFNTCGWTGDSASASEGSDAGTSDGGTAMRNETLTTNPDTASVTLPPGTQPPVTSSTEYVNTNTTMPEGQGFACAMWAAMETVPSGQSDLAASSDMNVRFTCVITARNKTKCTAKCLNGGKIVGKNKFVMSCKCPRWVSPRSLVMNHYVIILRNTLCYYHCAEKNSKENIQNGEKQCGWYAKSQFQAQLSSEFIQGLTCDTGAATTTPSPGNEIPVITEAPASEEEISRGAVITRL